MSLTGPQRQRSLCEWCLLPFPEGDSGTSVDSMRRCDACARRYYDAWPPICMTIYGRPQQRGSKRPYPFKRKDESLGVSVPDDNPKSKAWMSCVIDTARGAYKGDIIIGPLRLVVRFAFLRRKCHYGTGRNATTLKASAPEHYMKTPDTDKLVRCLADALQGVVYRDDSQIVHVNAIKEWTTGAEHARVMLQAVE